jgi:nitrogen fixation/metabolism regulation signal transduction histidine kinase
MPPASNASCRENQLSRRGHSSERGLLSGHRRTTPQAVDGFPHRSLYRPPVTTASVEGLVDRFNAAGLAPVSIAALVAALASAADGGVLLSSITAVAAALLVGLIANRVRRRQELAATPDSSSTPDLVRVVADATPDAVLFFSDAGVIRYANAGARELFFDGAEPEGKNFLALLGNASAPLREALLGESDQLFSLEVEGRQETYHVSRRTFPLEGEAHTILAVKHLTREIGSREVGVLKQVVRVISHEVNNSLAPVSSLAHSARLLARAPNSEAKLASVFDTIEERVNHLCTFLEGYAAIARLPRPTPRAVDSARFVQQLALLHPEVRVHEAPRDPGWFDPVQIEQVVINLVKNARETGGALSDVELSLETNPDGEAKLSVLDRGPGFSEEALRNALLPLYTTKERGSGMGLALCREIVEAHRGSLVIANRSGGGAVVRVALPGKVPSDTNLTRSRLRLGQTPG